MSRLFCLPTRLGPLINRYRIERRLTAAALARMVGIDPSHVGKIENGETMNPGFATVGALAVVLRIPPQELISTCIPEDMLSTLEDFL